MGEAVPPKWKRISIIVVIVPELQERMGHSASSTGQFDGLQEILTEEPPDEARGAAEAEPQRKRSGRILTQRWGDDEVLKFGAAYEGPDEL